MEVDGKRRRLLIEAVAVPVIVVGLGEPAGDPQRNCEGQACREGAGRGLAGLNVEEGGDRLVSEREGADEKSRGLSAR